MSNKALLKVKPFCYSSLTLSLPQLKEVCEQRGDAANCQVLCRMSGGAFNFKTLHLNVRCFSII